MIANLDEVRRTIEELSTELGITDPVSGNVVSKVGEFCKEMRLAADQKK